MKFAIQIRMSTDRQEDSPDTQRRILADWAARNGHEIVAEYLEEALSGGLPTEKRPALLQLLADARDRHRTFDAVLTVRRDRFGRDPDERVANLRYLIRHHCPLWTPEGEVAFDTPSEVLIERIIAAVDEHERKITGVRIREHNTARLLQGKHPSGYLPLGYTYHKGDKEQNRPGHVTVNDRAPDVIRLFEIFAECDGNATATARAANREGLRSARGNRMDANAVLYLLRNPVYRRRVHYNGREVEAPQTIPELIPPELLARVDALLGAVRHIPNRAKAAPNALCGLLVCGLCGSRLTFSRHTIPGPSGHPSVGWVCQGRRAGLCDARGVSHKILDTLLGRALHRLFAAAEQLLPADPDSGTMQHNAATCGNVRHNAQKSGNMQQIPSKTGKDWKILAETGVPSSPPASPGSSAAALTGSTRRAACAAPDTPDPAAPSDTPRRASGPTREQLQGQRARWAELYADGEIDRPTYDKRVRAIDAALARQAQPAPAPRTITPAQLDAWRATLATGWPALPDAQRRPLLLALAAEIVITSAHGIPRTLLLHTAVAPPIEERYSHPTRKHPQDTD